MNAIGRTLEQTSSLADIFQPFEAFFFFNRDARGIDVALERRGSFELFARPKLDRPRPSGRPSVVMTRLECMSSPHTVRLRGRFDIKPAGLHLDW
jgi:hypothetical protein